MINVVLDSDIVIDFTRQASPFFREILDLANNKKIALFIPSIVVIELMSGQETKSSNKLKILEDLIKPAQFVACDYSLSKQAGFIVRDSRGLVQSGDAIVAATALSLNAKLATRNKKHFQGVTGLKFYSPR